MKNGGTSTLLMSPVTNIHVIFLKCIVFSKTSISQRNKWCVGVIAKCSTTIQTWLLKYRNFLATNFRKQKGFVKELLKRKAIPNGIGIIAGIKAVFLEKDATRVALLYEGMKWKAIHRNNSQEAQIIEQARFSIEDIGTSWLNNIAPQ
jgi:hypothetical protein